MNKIIVFLQGKKTYIVAAIIMLQAALAYLNGEVNGVQALNQVLTGMGLGTLRAGLSKTA